MPKKLLVLLFLITIFTTACVGDGGSSSADDSGKKYAPDEIEQVLNLPPAPDEEENNSTVLGIDSNNNDIRDDIERHIGLNHYPNMFEVNALNEMARSNTRQIKAYEAKDWGTLNAEYMKRRYAKRCIIISRVNENTSDDDVYKWTMDIQNIAYLERDTEERVIFRRYLDAAATVPSRMPNYQELQNYCPRFAK